MHSGATEGISFPAAVLQRVTVYRTRCAAVTLVGVGWGVIRAPKRAIVKSAGGGVGWGKRVSLREGDFLN